MRYGPTGSWLDNQPAAITRKAGLGTITYIGAWLDDAGMKRATQWMLTTSGLKPDLPVVPEGVEVYRRVGRGKEVFIIENFSHASRAVPLSRAMKDVLTGSVVHSVTLPVYGVAVLSNGK